MGSIVKANCQCGFEQKIHIGGGIGDFKKNCAFPCFCHHCTKLVVANMMANNKDCPICENDSLVSYMHNTIASIDGDRNVISWRLQKDGVDEMLMLDNGHYICPQCKGVSLTFSLVGMFD
ncbi:MAG: hypothetical protein P8H22_09800 [Glaciecola sp.]|nr:hypothetical protein [Glaciecola sp.]